MTLDETDLKIIEELKQNSRATVRELAKRLGQPITTVHNRFRKLKKDGAIQRFTIEPDYEKLGRGVCAFVMAGIDHEKLLGGKEGLEGLKRQLRRFPEVERIYAVTGEIDLVLLVRTASIKELDEFLIRKLRNIHGVQKTVTQIVLEEG
ncbi:MAG: Lrp/AsnC family transcriptional regulator [Candidatus Aenigmarchaeota archaeon]|nr:Lrp/AsnC family transcriptional regulator [Candidatus Aenigmarchaeota archaeon]